MSASDHMSWKHLIIPSTSNNTFSAHWIKTSSNLLQNPFFFLDTCKMNCDANCHESDASRSSTAATACQASFRPSKSHKAELLTAAAVAEKTGVSGGWTDGIWHGRLTNVGAPARMFRVTSSCLTGESPSTAMWAVNSCLKETLWCRNYKYGGGSRRFQKFSAWFINLC